MTRMTAIALTLFAMLTHGCAADTDGVRDEQDLLEHPIERGVGGPGQGDQNGAADGDDPNDADFFDQGDPEGLPGDVVPPIEEAPEPLPPADDEEGPWDEGEPGVSDGDEGEGDGDDEDGDGPVPSERCEAEIGPCAAGQMCVESCTPSRCDDEGRCTQDCRLEFACVDV